MPSLLVHSGNAIIPAGCHPAIPVTERLLFSACLLFLPRRKQSFHRAECNPKWWNPDHFENCSNFEQSLLK